MKDISENWNKVEERLPSLRQQYDLMDLLTEKGRGIRGWWTGQAWDGLHYNDQKIVMWKPSKYNA